MGCYCRGQSPCSRVQKVCPCACRPVCLSVFVCLSACLPVCLCLPASLSVCLSVLKCVLLYLCACVRVRARTRVLITFSLSPPLTLSLGPLALPHFCLTSRLECEHAPETATESRLRLLTRTPPLSTTRQAACLRAPPPPRPLSCCHAQLELECRARIRYGVTQCGTAQRVQPSAGAEGVAS